MNDRDKVRLTTLSHGSGWACKIGPGDLSEVLGNLKQTNHDSVVLGFEGADDAAAIRLNDEKLLVKSEDEYTSPISKIYKVESEYIIVTENSIYVVSAEISTKRIS